LSPTLAEKVALLLHGSGQVSVSGPEAFHLNIRISELTALVETVTPVIAEVAPTEFDAVHVAVKVPADP
jgi:hypothetical protein